MSIARLRLKKNEDRRLRAGHLWIFSNEIDTKLTPLTQFTAGQQVLIETAHGAPLGVAYINPHALLCARLISRNPQENLSKELISQRLQTALSLRERLFPKPFYRLVFGESDFLPGLIVDRYADIFVVQITTAGMENISEIIREVLIEQFQPAGILLRNDISIRALENLPENVIVWHGEVPEEFLLTENNVNFYAPLLSGQKTGWFYDHRLSRSRLENYVKNKRVLDVFSYCGAWGIQAALYGAEQVTCLDSSATAIHYVQKNAELNSVQNKVNVLTEDAFKGLNLLQQNKDFFDVIILDPPAFIKKRKDYKSGMQAYRRLNDLALKILKPGGILISASCSQHLNREDLLTIVRQTALQHNRFAQILEEGHQAPDHPIHPAISETNYLKTFFVNVN